MSIPLPVLPNVYYSYMYGSYLGRRVGSVFCFKSALAVTSSGQDLSNAAAVATAVGTSWATNMRPRYPSVYGDMAVKVYPLGHNTLPAVTQAVSGTGVSGADVAAFPTAAVIKHSVLRRGKGSQSHTLISPIFDDQVDSTGENLTDTARSGLQDDFDAFIADAISAYASAVSGDSIVYVQLSKKGSGATYAITGSTVESLLGSARARSQRHR